MRKLVFALLALAWASLFAYQAAMDNAQALRDYVLGQVGRRP